MPANAPYRVKSISDFHKYRGLPMPQHPLVSVVNVETIQFRPDERPKSVMFDFYSIALKKNFTAKMRYGQQEYDFDGGMMSFMAPGQVFRIELDHSHTLQQSGWMLFIHPDFLWNTPLAKTIRQYGFFDYAVNEALFLSEREEAIITGIMQNIGQEYQTSIDQFSQDIIISQIELLLTYAERFYHRQFITRKITGHEVLSRLERLLDDYFGSETIINKGLPTVNHIAAQLNVSPGYLSSLLKVLTGQNTQQHIHEKLIEKAKEKLSTTTLSVSEIAYALGFEHPQSFSKLFKTKTSQSPLEFRARFN